MKSHIYITLVVLLLAGAVYMYPVPVYPNGQPTTDRTPEFFWIGNADIIVVDELPDFTTPIIENVTGFRHSLTNELGFGVHYWKLGLSPRAIVKKVEVQSEVRVAASDDNGSVNLGNIGNADLEIEVQEKNRTGWSITGLVTLPRGVSKKFKEDRLLIAKQNE